VGERPEQKLTESEIMEAAKTEAASVSKHVENTQVYVSMYTRVLKEAYNRIKSENK